MEKEYPPQTKNENIKTYDNFTAQNHTIYCNNKMLYLGGIQRKVWHPQIVLKRYSFFEKRNTHTEKVTCG